MRAARFHGQRDIRVEDVPEPDVRTGEVKIKVAWNGICGSDLHDYLMGPNLSPQPGKPHPLSGAEPPVVFGHEISGTIAAFGDGVDLTRFKVGQHVVVDAVVGCNKCFSCQNLKSPNLCRIMGLIGITGWGGGLSEYLNVPQANVHVVPDHVPHIAACIEPIAVAWHAANRVNLQEGQTCLIAGGGPIGLFMLKVLKARGAGVVIVSEPVRSRRNRATIHGADYVVDPTATNLQEQVMQITQEVGVDVAFDCAGISASLNACLLATRPLGIICIISLWESQAVINPNEVVLAQKLIMGSSCYNNCHPEAIRAVADGRLSNIEDLITRRISINNVVEQGFEALVNDKDNQIKILVRPTP